MKSSSFLKHIFIPHEGNNYKPHFFREHVVLSFALTALILLLISFTSYTVIRTTKFGSSVVASVLINLTNKTRSRENLPLLYRNQNLQYAATLKGEDMLSRQYFGHYAPDGTSPWDFMKKARYSFSYAGENLAFNFKNSYEVENAWLNSKDHKANILNPIYRDIGIAVTQGTYNDSPVLFVVQMFGKANTQLDIKKEQDGMWYYPFLFNATYYIDITYKLLSILIMVALALMIFIEIKKQHYLHILYGILLLIVVGICAFINASFS